MNYKVENKFYDKIKQKVVDGIFIEGKIVDLVDLNRIRVCLRITLI